MQYVIKAYKSSGSGYLCKNGKNMPIMSDDISEASTWRTADAAKKYAVSLKSRKKGDWKHYFYDVVSTEHEQPKAKKECKSSVEQKGLLDYLSGYDETPDDADVSEDIAKAVSEFSSFFTNLQPINDKLNERLRTCDLMLNDIQHYIEFSDLSDAEAIATIAKIKEVTKERRRIKDGIYKIHLLTKELDADKIQKLDDVVSSGDSRKYTPKVLVNLFDGKEILK